MKQRIFSAAVGLVILFTVIWMFETIAVNIAVSIIIILAIDELISAAGYRDNLALKCTCIAFGAMLPFIKTNRIDKMLPSILFLFALILFYILLQNHDVLRVEQLGFIFSFTLAISLSMSCLIFMRDLLGFTVGLFAIVVALVGAWMSDSGAYFCGLTFGKHKLAPSISPKKTVEGAIGGIVIALISQLTAAYIYIYVMASMGIAVEIKWTTLMLLSPVISVLSIIGDLVASVIKRQFGIKDFGKIMPGHGGVLDRFDSVLLVIPFVYNLFIVHPLIVVL